MMNKAHKGFAKGLSLIGMTALVLASLAGCSSPAKPSTAVAPTVTVEQTTTSPAAVKPTVTVETSSLVTEPESIKIYNHGVIKVYTKEKNPEKYLKVIHTLESSFEKEANPLRLDEADAYAANAKAKGAGIELVYKQMVTTHYPSFDKSTIDETYKSLLIPIDSEDTMMLFEGAKGYSTAPIYLKKENEMKKLIE